MPQGAGYTVCIVAGGWVGRGGDSKVWLRPRIGDGGGEVTDEVVSLVAGQGTCEPWGRLGMPPSTWFSDTGSESGQESSMSDASCIVCSHLWCLSQT